MTVSLKALVEVRAGHPFRGSVPATDDGNARVIQMRDVSAEGTVAWAQLPRTDLPPGKATDWLHDGDVLFAARGGRNYAVCLAGVPAHTVCSQYFFVLRCKSPGLLPEYLAWTINRAPCQRYLASNAEGTDQLSIRRGVLEDMPIALPSLERQRHLVALAAAARQERRCLEALIQNREQQLDALAHELLSTPNFPA
jgi:hypothetical protein